MMILCVFCNLFLSRNQPLGLVDDLYIEILKNETKILRSLRSAKNKTKRLVLVI